MKLYNKKGFTLIEMIIVMTILSILGTFTYYKYSENEVEQYFSAYTTQVTERVEELYKKSLVGINWHYNNNSVEDVDYVKIYCDNINKTLFAYICDNTNSLSPAFNNCRQIDFPTLDNLEYGTFLGSYTKKNIDINNCLYLDNGSNIYQNGSYYIKINTVFPQGKIGIYRENPANTQDNESDDTEVGNIKVNVKDGITVKEFYPIYFK